MGINIVDLLFKIPGFTKVYHFFRQKIIEKKPPSSYSLVTLIKDRNVSSTPQILFDHDNHGVRLQIGELPLQSVLSRSNLGASDDTFETVVNNDAIEIINNSNKITLQFYQTETWVKVEITHQSEQIFGLGEKNRDLDKSNNIWKFWNSDHSSFDVEDDPLYKSYPIAILHQNQSWIAIIIDYPGYQCWDLSQPYQFKIHCQSKNANIDILYATTPKILMKKISKILGQMDLPPLWSLGYHQCRWSYTPADEVRRIASEFRQRHIPCDAIYLDIDYMDDFRCFTYDLDNFGSLPELVEDLHDDKFKVVAMIDPGIKYDEGYFVFDEGIAQDVFMKQSDGSVYTASVWAGKSVFPDFFQSQTQQWWGNLYHEFITQFGIDGIWNDMNEPAIFNLRGTMPDYLIHQIEGEPVQHQSVHNLYGQLMVKSSYQGIQRLKPKERVFLLSRSGYLGSQKYGWIWTGDNEASWSHLQQSIPKLLNSGLSGHFANGPDIGGFRGKPSAELYARWIQLGVFYPFMRTHTSKFTGQQEPWSFGKEVEDIARNMISLRYRLLPYIYTYFREGCHSGIPLMRPMWMEFPDDEVCYNPDIMNVQFMFGPDLLVAPVLENDRYTIEVYLPEGTWYHYFSRKEFRGGKTIKISAELDEINIFVREDTIIPVYKKVGDTVEETHQSGIEFMKFGDNAEGRLYVDDGHSLQYSNDEFAVYRITSDLDLELIDGTNYDVNTSST